MQSYFGISNYFNKTFNRLRTNHSSQLSFETFLTPLVDISKAFEKISDNRKFSNLKKPCYSIKDLKNNFKKSRKIASKPQSKLEFISSAMGVLWQEDASASLPFRAISNQQISISRLYSRLTYCQQILE